MNLPAVMKVSIDGGAVTYFASDPNHFPVSFAIDATNLYWTSFDDGRDCGGLEHQHVLSAPLGGGTPTTIASDQCCPSGIAVDATSVYWVNGDGDPNLCPGMVMKAPLGGGPAVVLATGEVYPYGIAVDANNVYWTNYWEGTVKKMPLDGGTPVTLYANPNAYPQNIAIDAHHVYWTDGTNGAVLAVGK
jgi:hypothetical protein